MAKVGEGDPRWLVENRDDGRNVNNWHWSEKDCLAWSKIKLTQLLGESTLIDDDNTFIKTTSSVSVTGECTANNRKGKTIFLYELEVKVSWEGKLKIGDITAKGDFVAPYVADENDDEKPKINVTVAGDTTTAADKLKDLARIHGIPFLQSKILEYIQELKDTFTLRKPPTVQTDNNTINSTTLPQTAAATAAANGGEQQQPNGPVSMKLTPKPKASTTKTLTIRKEFRASPMQVYDMFVNADMIKSYTQSDCTFEKTEGGKFSLYSGHITGINEKLSPGSTIIQKWRLAGWPDNIYSTVTIKFSVGDSPVTIVDIVQTGIPTEEYQKTQEGWNINILRRLEMIFGSEISY